MPFRNSGRSTMPAQMPIRRPGLVCRRGVLLAGLGAALLAGCAEEAPPPDFPPLRFDYLTKLRLMVASIDVDTTWMPPADAGSMHVEALAPVPPAQALRQMAQERLIPAGADGHAAFVIDDASLVQVNGQYVGSMKVHVDVIAADGSRPGPAEAQVVRTRAVADDVRATLYDLVQDLMTAMNVEFEYQVRHSLRGFLQGSTETAPPPAPVQQQDLDGAAPPPTAEPPAAPQPAPPPPAAVTPPADTGAPTPLTQ